MLRKGMNEDRGMGERKQKKNKDPRAKDAGYKRGPEKTVLVACAGVKAVLLGAALLKGVSTNSSFKLSQGQRSVKYNFCIFYDIFIFYIVKLYFLIKTDIRSKHMISSISCGVKCLQRVCK